MRATAPIEPGPVDRLLTVARATPADWSTTKADPHNKWTNRRGPVTRMRPGHPSLWAAQPLDHRDNPGWVKQTINIAEILYHSFSCVWSGIKNYGIPGPQCDDF